MEIMKGFIEITPKYYNMSNALFDQHAEEWIMSKPETINISHIVRFGENFIRTNENPEAFAISTVETYEEIKQLIIEAQ